MFTLEILKKVADGKLRPHEKRDIEAAVPLFEDYLKHDQLDVIQAMLEVQLQLARPQGREHERDVYWSALYEIASASRRKGSATAAWVKQELSAPRFPPHTKEECEARRDEQQARYSVVPDTLPPLISRHGPESHAINAFSTLQAAVMALDVPTALAYAELIVQKYKAQIAPHLNSTTVKHGGTLLGLDGSKLKFSGYYGAGELTVPYLRGLARLADKVDAILGTKGTRTEFIKATFAEALAAPPDNPVAAYILKQADRLSQQDRLDIVLHHAALHQDNQGKSLCGTIENYHRNSMFHTGDIALFNKFIATLQRWTAQSKKIDFTRSFFLIEIKYLNFHDQENLHKKGIYTPDRFKRHFAPDLRWAEIARRLEMVRAATSTPMVPFDFETNHYLEQATIRATTYGHADDLRAIFDYYEGLTPEQKTARGFTNGFLHGFPKHEYYGRISRDPATLQVLADRMPLNLWFRSGGNGNAPFILRVMTLPQGDQFDDVNDNMVSYVAAGRAMSYPEVVASYKVLGPLLEKSLPLLNDVQRVNMADYITREHYKPPLRESIGVLQQGGQVDAPALWVRTIYALHTPVAAREALGKLAYSLADRTRDSSQLAMLTGFAKAVRDTDPDPVFWDEIKSSFAMSSKLIELCVTHAVEPETLKPSVLESRFLAKVREKNGLLYDLHQEAKAELGLPVRQHYKDPHLNTRLLYELLPHFITYQEIEHTHNALEQVNRLATLFSTFRQVDTFLRRHAQPTRQPVHDLCMFTLPQSENWSKEIWSNLVLRYGHPILRLLPHAPGIETYIREHIEPMNAERRRINRDKLGKTGAAVHDRTLSLETMTPTMIRAIAVRVGYKRGTENRAVANFCINLMAEETAFNETLDLLATFTRAGKGKDCMPNITIDGATIGLDGYRMERVPHGDPLSLWIGKIVNCCNYLGGDGADMARAQFKDPKNALYIIRDQRDRPIAKLSGWLSTKGNVVFNAWERKSEQEDFLLSRFALAAGLHMLEANPKIKRVMLGAGPLDRRSLPFQLAATPEIAGKSIGHTRDSDQQFIVAERRELGEAYEKLDWEIAAAPQRGEFRIKLRWDELDRLNHG